MTSLERERVARILEKKQEFTIREWLYAYLNARPDRKANTDEIRLAAKSNGFRWESVKKLAQRNTDGLKREELTANVWEWSLTGTKLEYKSEPMVPLSDLVACQEKFTKIKDLANHLIDELTDSQLTSFHLHHPGELDILDA